MFAHGGSPSSLRLLAIASQYQGEFTLFPDIRTLPVEDIDWYRYFERETREDGGVVFEHVCCARHFVGLCAVHGR